MSCSNAAITVSSSEPGSCQKCSCDWGMTRSATRFEAKVSALEAVLQLADGLANVIAPSALFEEIYEVIGHLLGV